jgi:hypothetical protein
MAKNIFHIGLGIFALFFGWSVGGDILTRLGTPPPAGQ